MKIAVDGISPDAQIRIAAAMIAATKASSGGVPLSQMLMDADNIEKYIWTGSIGGR